MPDNISENSQPTGKRQRGRPKKVLTPDEILALQNAPKRPRGRPKKEWTEEELAALAKMEKRQRGRPHKVLSPQEEWVLNYAPKKGERGRPQKNKVLHLSLPQIIIQLAKNNPKIEEKLPEIEKKMEIIEEKWEQKSASAFGQTEKTMPAMSWREFKEKIKIAELPDDLPETYLFPVETEPVEHIKIVRRNLPRRAEINFKDLAPKEKEIPFVSKEEVKYLWEEEGTKNWRQKHVREILGFDMPEDAPAVTFHHGKSEKKKIQRHTKVDLIKNQESFVAPLKTKKQTRHGFFYFIFDLPLTIIGKILYFSWAAITAPFRFLDFLVDRTLKGIWFGFAFVLHQIVALINSNISFLTHGVKHLFGRRNLSPAKVSTDSHSHKKSVFKPFLNFGLTALIIVLPLFAINSWQKAKQAQGDVLGVSSEGLKYLEQATGAFGANNLIGALNNFNKAESSFYLAQKQIEELGPLTNSLIKFVPKARDGEKLLSAGELLSSSAAALSSAFAAFDSKDISLTEKISYLRQEIEKQTPSIEKALALISEIDSSSLPKDGRAKFETIKQGAKNWQGTIGQFSALLSFTEKLFGSDGAKRYLIIFQNNNELRPTGGFMGSFALVDVEKGKVKKMEVPGGGLYDLKTGSQVSVAAPKPLQIFSPVWQIWNANWFPDWPKSAEKIVWFYENNFGGSSVDGVISLTDDSVADLLKILGPMEMAEFNKTLTAENFSNEVQMAVELEYDKEKNQPKEIIGEMAPLLLEKLMNLKPTEYLGVLNSLNKSLSQKKILFYFNDPAAEKLADSFGWTGKIISTDKNQDYLMVVHTNISGGKTDGVIKNSVSHKVEVGENGELLATVTLTRDHQGDPSKVFENDNNVDYVRFYVPEGSKFVSATGFNFSPEYLFKYGSSENIQPDKTLAEVETNISLDEATGTRLSQEFGKTVFGNWLQVAPGQKRTVQISYLLPFKFSAENKSKLKDWFMALTGQKDEVKYSLVVEKQLGMDAVDFQSEFVLPENFRVKETAGKVERKGSAVSYSTNLLKDGYFGVLAEK